MMSWGNSLTGRNDILNYFFYLWDNNNDNNNENDSNNVFLGGVILKRFINESNKVNNDR